MQFITIIKIWLIEFEKVDLDGDKAISLLYDGYFHTVSRCCP